VRQARTEIGGNLDEREVELNAKDQQLKVLADTLTERYCSIMNSIMKHGSRDRVGQVSVIGETETAVGALIRNGEVAGFVGR
jgi:hypothetical protein